MQVTGTRRLLDFVLVWLIAGAIWILARLLWPYLELVAPVGALVVLLLAINVIDAVSFAIRRRSRFAFGRATSQHQGTTQERHQVPPRSAAVGFTGAR
jgi:hypothetical protein